jgi:hypothetical protein
MTTLNDKLFIIGGFSHDEDKSLNTAVFVLDGGTSDILACLFSTKATFTGKMQIHPASPAPQAKESAPPPVPPKVSPTPNSQSGIHPEPRTTNLAQSQSPPSHAHDQSQKQLINGKCFLVLFFMHCN